MCSPVKSYVRVEALARERRELAGRLQADVVREMADRAQGVADCAPRMALEFALRPRIDLERPAPRRRRGRLPRFALLMAAYWAGMAGATVVLLRIMKEAPEPALVALDTDEPAAEPAAENPAEVDDAVEANTQTAAPAQATVASPEPPAAFRAEPSAGPSPPEPPLRSTRLAPEPLPRSTRLAPQPLPRVELRVSELPARVDSRTPERRLRPAPLEGVAARSTEPARAEPPPTSLPSCETAAASANETLDLRGAPGAPDLPREAFAAVLDDGAYLAACALPPGTALDICAAVQDGKVVGVSASTEPRNPALNACARRAVAGLRFPSNPRLDVTRTRFDAAR